MFGVPWPLGPWHLEKIRPPHSRVVEKVGNDGNRSLRSRLQAAVFVEANAVRPGSGRTGRPGVYPPRAVRYGNRGPRPPAPQVGPNPSSWPIDGVARRTVRGGSSYDVQGAKFLLDYHPAFRYRRPFRVQTSSMMFEHLEEYLWQSPAQKACKAGEPDDGE